VAVLATLGLVGPALPGAAASQAGTRAPDAPAVPVLHWEACTGAGQSGFECATAEVPLDYQHPHRPMIQLAVIKHPATDPARRIGSLFFNPGGPGHARTVVLPLEYSFFPAAVRERFDVISWDPRGVGQSTAVQCFSSVAAEVKFFADLVAGFPVGTAQQNTWISLYERFGQICEQADPALLSHISTADSARDLDLLRQAVGSPLLNYYAVSYCTYLGATYANLFPSKVGAMVLDGNVSPMAWATSQQVDDTPLSTFIGNQNDAGAAATLGQFLTLCGQAAADGCAFSAGTGNATSAKYMQLLKELRGHPVTTSIPALGNIPKTSAITFTYAFTVSYIIQDL
jgi:pimeloyl-ACP methyl ester carboxylesterase